METSVRPLRYTAALAWLLTPLCGFAAELPSADMTFATNAAAGGLAEVQAAQLAEKKAASASVKHFAQQMEKDHSAANNELMQLAKVQSISLPTGPDSAHATALEQMAKLSGAAFDREYMLSQLSEHRKAVVLFQKQAGSGQDTQLKAFAQKYLPTLQHHLQMAGAVKVGS
jgi:putative membrane protein